MKRIILFLLTVSMLLTLAACGSKPAENSDSNVPLDVSVLYEKISSGAQLPEMLELDESLMLDYCGIKAEDVAEAKVVICGDSLRADEIWVVEAKDTAAADAIAKLAQSRLEKKGEESITYSPEQYAVVEKAELLRKDSFVVLIVSPDSEKLGDILRRETGLK